MPADLERTPVVLHPKPAPVVMPSKERRGPPPLPSRHATPLGLGNTLAPLARVDTPRPEAHSSSNRRLPVPGSEVYTSDEEPTDTEAAQLRRHVRNYTALAPEDRRLVDAFVLRLRPGAGG